MVGSGHDAGRRPGCLRNSQFDTDNVTEGSRATPCRRLVIIPAQGGPSTVFRASFTPPSGAPSAAGVRTGFDLGLSGPKAQNCALTAGAHLNAAGAGAAMTANLAPSLLGGHWCPGTYAVRVTEVQSPVCAAGTMCPQFVRVIGVVARASFTVTPH